MSFEIEANQYVIRVYSGEHKDNYIASALIRTYGDFGLMSSITGKGFYEELRDHFDEILEAVKVKTLEGYVVPAHARLMRIMCRGRCKFKILRSGQCAGRQMVWVQFSSQRSDDERV